MEKIIIKEEKDIRDNFKSFLADEKKGEIILPVLAMNIFEWYIPHKRLSPCAALLGICQKDLERVVYYTAYILRLEDGTLKIMNEAEFVEYKQNHEDIKNGMSYMGASAIKSLIDDITNDDLKIMCQNARTAEKKYLERLDELNDILSDNEDEYEDEDEDECEDKCEDEDNNENEDNSCKNEYFEIMKKLEETRILLEAIWTLRKYGSSKFFIDKVQMFPHEIRRMLNEFSKHSPYTVDYDIRYLYSRLACRCSRLEKLQGLNAPEIILRNEARMMQEYLDTLLANGRRGKPVVSCQNGPAVLSLADIVERTMRFV